MAFADMRWDWREVRRWGGRGEGRGVGMRTCFWVGMEAVVGGGRWVVVGVWIGGGETVDELGAAVDGCGESTVALMGGSSLRREGIAV